METTLLIIAALVVLALGVLFVYVALRLFSEGGFWNCLNAQMCLESGLKMIGFVFVGIFQAIGEANN